jgi:arabinofuranosyltransferase
VIILSKSFIDFSTSGLENPLTHLLLILFFIIYFKDENGKKKLLLLSFISSLVILNRLDTILIFIPALIISYLKVNRFKGLLIIVLGFMPFFLWEFFSLFYYGFFFPNTAYAKLNTGINKFDLINQGLNYLLNSIYLDPITPFIIISGILISFFSKNRSIGPISAGMILYLLYIINIGGDFMSGRFLSVPLLCALVILSKIEIGFNKTIYAISIIFLFTILTPYPNYLNSSSYGLGPRIVSSFKFGPQIFVTNNNGISDERYNYYPTMGLLRNIKDKNLDKHPWIKIGYSNKKNKPKVFTKGQIGFIGFFSGNSVYVLDQYALSDPLLSKLPATEYWLVGRKVPEGERFWNIGHFTRKIPAGYLETVETEINKIEDPNLKKYYDKLSFIIKGDLFDTERLIEIINMNLGKYGYLLDKYNQTLTSKKTLSDF